MFLWELKNSIISQNLRELCVIETPKPNRKIPPTVASTSSATVLFITTHAALACWRPFLFLPVISWTSFADFQSVLNHRIIYYYSRCLSLSKAHSHFSSRCLSLSKAHYFYCIKIRALYRTSLMFLWELKNTIISQNLRELCDIKTNTKNPHTVASTSSATNSFITRCLSLSKAHSQFSSRCLSLSKAHYFYCIKNPCTP